MTEQQKVIRAKVGILELAKRLSNVSHAFRVMGYALDRFCRFKDICDKGGEAALHEISGRRPRSVRISVCESCQRRRSSLATNDRRGGQVGAASYFAVLKKRLV